MLKKWFPSQVELAQVDNEIEKLVDSTTAQAAKRTLKKMLHNNPPNAASSLFL